MKRREAEALAAEAEERGYSRGIREWMDVRDREFLQALEQAAGDGVLIVLSNGRALRGVVVKVSVSHAFGPAFGPADARIEIAAAPA